MKPAVDATQRQIARAAKLFRGLSKVETKRLHKEVGRYGAGKDNDDLPLDILVMRTVTALTGNEFDEPGAFFSVYKGPHTKHVYKTLLAFSDRYAWVLFHELRSKKTVTIEASVLKPFPLAKLKGLGDRIREEFEAALNNL